MSTVGKFFAVAAFEGDVIEAIDLVDAIRSRASIGGPTFVAEIEAAYQALYRARYEIDSWKDGNADA